MEAFGKYLNLVVVDDEPEIAKLLELELRPEFARIDVVASGAEALAIVEKQPVDIVITDKVMPEMGGLELLQRINELDSSIIKVMMTAHADLASAVKAFDCNAFDFVLKPIVWEELHAKLARACRQRVYNLDYERQLLEILGESRLRDVIEDLNGKSPEERAAVLDRAKGMLELKRSRYFAVRSLEKFRL